MLENGNWNNWWCLGGEGIEFSTERFSNGVWEVLTTSQITKQLYYPSYVVHKDTIILFGGWEGENEPTDCVWWGSIT